uniref:Putative LOV domain-containing protein n=1 Tax=Ptilidium pulcherrimum TaxID=3143427 RepID=A0A126WY99_9MARC|nr:putative LOV domain-containing protein [Ptilidium ciliare var. pulcherrimum]
MGKPFIPSVEDKEVPRQDKPQSQLLQYERGVHEVFGQSQKVNLTLAKPLESQSAAPHDALQAAENYLQQISESTFRNSSARAGQPSTLFETLVEETRQQSQLHEGPAVLQSQQRAPIGEAIQVRSFLADVNRSILIAQLQEYMNVEWPGDFSLDDSDVQCKLEDAVLALPVVSSSPNSKWAEVSTGGNSAEARGVSSRSLDSGGTEFEADQGLEIEHSHYDSILESMKWDTVLRGMSIAGSPESQTVSDDESFRSARMSGLSSTDSSDSMSDEAISERAAVWGNDVAKMVVKNFSRRSTPRTSNCSPVGTQRYSQEIPRISKDIKDAVSAFQLAFLVCDALDLEAPILYASAGFFHMTGYSAEEVVGRNCRFLQGIDTDTEEVARVRGALKRGESYTGTLLNYKKDGTCFWNLLTLSPIRDDSGKLIKYIGMQAEVDRPMLWDRRKEVASELKITKDMQNPVGQWGVPRLASHSTNKIPPVISSQSKRSFRGDAMPVFSLNPTSQLTATHGPQATSASNRYSLTIASSRSIESRVEVPRAHVGSNRYSLIAETRRSVESLSETPLRESNGYSLIMTSGTSHSTEPRERPLIWHLANEERSAVDQLHLHESLSEEIIPKTNTRKDFNEGPKNKNGRGTLRILRLFRNLERKFSNRQKTSVSAGKACYSRPEADRNIEERPQISATSKYYSERRDPHDNGIRDTHHTSTGASLYSSADRTDLESTPRPFSFADLRMRVQSCRYSTTATPDPFSRRQFCIV